jgi:hypothetical protein
VEAEMRACDAVPCAASWGAVVKLPSQDPVAAAWRCTTIGHGDTHFAWAWEWMASWGLIDGTFDVASQIDRSLGREAHELARV